MQFVFFNCFVSKYHIWISIGGRLVVKYDSESESKLYSVDCLFVFLSYYIHVFKKITVWELGSIEALQRNKGKRSKPKSKDIIKGFYL